MKKANQPDAEELSRETATRKGRLDRRTLLRAGALAGGMAGVGAGIARAAETVGADAPDWMKTPGRSLSTYGMPSKYQEKVQRALTLLPGRPGTGSSRTPIQLLEGTITPNGLHFERHHNGVPDIDPSRHELVIHGMVKRPLAFTLDTLMRYPMETHIRFIECAGNSGGFNQAQPQQTTAGGLNGPLFFSLLSRGRVGPPLGEGGGGRRGHGG